MVKPSHTIIKGKYFADKESGRWAGLRGVNLSGSCKLPTAIKISKETCVEISFKDRPFPLAQAHEHLARLSYWGLTLIRVLVPWEALEPYGPGQYDEEYIDYLVGLLHLFPKYGLQAIIDPHQDVWSRITGGSGNPTWTVHAAGLAPKDFLRTYAADNHFEIGAGESEDEVRHRVENWAGNYSLLACSTMFTLFFGGRKFAPNCLVGKENIQDYLMNSHLSAYKHVASRIVKEGLTKVVLGVEIMNEVHPGYIGVKDIEAPSTLPIVSFKSQFSPLESMRLGMGQSSEVEGACVWKESCVWLKHGVWGLDGSFKKEYFSKDPITGEPVDFLKDFWYPYARDFAKAIHSIWEEAIIFVQPPFLPACPSLTDISHPDIPNAAFSPHWYDIDMLSTRQVAMKCKDLLGLLQGKYKGPDDPRALIVGRKNFRDFVKAQIQEMVDEGVRVLGDIPCCFTEFGVCFNLNQGEAYINGDYSQQVEGLDAYIFAMESAGVNFTLWNYTPENSHQEGDHWNTEDLSLISQDAPMESLKGIHLTQLDKGGRGVSAFVRPYAKLLPGIPTLQYFDLSQTLYHLRFQYIPEASNICEIFLPTHHYPPGCPLDIKTSHGVWSLALYPILTDGVATDPVSCSDPQVTTAPHIQYLYWDVSGTPSSSTLEITVSPESLN